MLTMSTRAEIDNVAVHNEVLAICSFRRWL